MSRYKLTVEGPKGEFFEKAVPSVTEIIDAVLAKNGLPDWYYKQAVQGFGTLLEKYGEHLPKDVRSLHSLMKSEGLSPYSVRDAAASQGIAIHNAVEALAKGRRPTVFPSLTTWWKDKGLKKDRILGAESLVYSGRHGYAGTVDLVYRDDPLTAPTAAGALGEGPVVLADIKTGAIRDSHEIQVELYRWAWEEMGNKHIDRLQIIQVPRDGSSVKVTDIPISQRLTLGAEGLLQAWRWKK